MNLDVIIPVSNLVPYSLEQRVDTLRYAIEHFYARQAGKSADEKGLALKLIVVEQSLDGNLYYLPNLPIEAKADYHRRAVEIQHIEIKHPVFNKSWCINVGFRHSTSDAVMVADPDMFCRQNYFSELLKFFSKIQWTFAWNALYYTDIGDKHMILQDKDPKVKPHCGPKKGYSEGGLVLFRRGFFEKMGMANEFIEELGGIDNEMMYRARHLQPQQNAYPMFVWHLWHEGSRKSERPSRKKNVAICHKVAVNPGKMVDILSKMGGGNINQPYCAKHKFDEVWDG